MERGQEGCLNGTGRDRTEATGNGALPTLEQVREDIWALAQPMPGGRLAYSLAYLLRGTDGRVHVIDPGTDSDGNWDRLVAALAVVAPEGPGGAADVAGITATHLHPDHLGLAARLRAASGAPLGMHSHEVRALQRHSERTFDHDEVAARLEEWGVPAERRPELARYVDRSPEGPMTVDRVLADGDTLSIPGFSIEVMATPGHTAGHICLRDDERAVLFTGDHVLPTVFPGLGLGGESSTNPLADYIESIGRVRRYTDHEALPGHGHRFTGLADRADECAEHHLARAREVSAVLAGRDASRGAPGVWEIASQLTWTAGWGGLEGFQLLSALFQTEMHREFVRAGGLPLR
jgi:glyoxylase-like metal-dependent hydrolase (beta-lactamase superfamily II)